MSASAIIERIRTLLETTPPFDQLSEEDRQDVLADISIEYYEPQEVIIEQGKQHHPGLYLIESGLVRLMDVEKQRLVDKCQEGDFFGSFGLLKGGGAIYQAKAIEETVCALIRVGRFQKLYDKNEDFALFFDRDIKRYMRHMDSTRDVSGRHLLLSRKLNELVFRNLVTCAEDASVQDVAMLMRKNSVRSVVVTKKNVMSGIVTDSDLRDKVLAQGRGGDVKVRSVMTKPVRTISSDKTLFDATMAMLQYRLHRLVVVSAEDENPVGVVTDRDIAHFRGLDPVATLQRIERAPTVERLCDIRSGANSLLLRLYRQGVSPEDVKRILSIFHDRLVIRVLDLTVKEYQSRYNGLLKRVPWAWLRLGSGGRQEAVLNSEQHNALVYADLKDDKEAKQAEELLNDFAETVNERLATCGFSMSEVVAKRSEWRRPLTEWKKAYRTWIHKADEEALKRVPFFFDLRNIFGDQSLVDKLKEDLVDALNVQAMDEDRKLLPLLAKNALKHRPPLSFFGRFVLERSGEHRNTFNIRDHGILPIVDAARVLALDIRYLDSVNTFDRLRAASEELPEIREPLEQAQDAYHYFIDFRLEHQLQAVESGDRPNNFIDPAVLSKLQQNLLRSAFTAAARLQDALADRYELRRGWNLRNT